MKTSYLFLLFFILNIGLFAKQTNRIEVLNPHNNDIFKVSIASVVVKINDRSIEKLKFISEAGDTFEKKVNRKRDTYCKTIKLEYGSNTIIIRAYSAKKKVADVMLEIYYKFPAYRATKYAPPRFKKNYFHTTKNEKPCLKCHDMSMNEIPNNVFEDVSDSNCFECHNNMYEEKKYVHAPAANWLCSSCHKNTKSAPTKYPSPKKIHLSCFECHKEFSKNYMTKKYRHEPLSTGGCIRCHDPHASPNKYFTRLEVKKLCVVCHGDKDRRVKKEGERCAASSKESCVECHSPHFSDKKFMYEPNRQHELHKRKKTLWTDEW